MRILIIEDDASVAEYIKKGLNEAGHVVEHFADGKSGLLSASTDSFDLLIVDRMLPHVSGTKLVTTLRATGDQTPVLFLSALGEVDQRVEGFSVGGDDYLVKPFAFSELLARVEALYRRSVLKKSVDDTLVVEDLVLDPRARKVTRNGQLIRLQPREFRLLEYLMRHAGQIVTRTMLLEQVWDFQFTPQTNVIDVHISRLRNKVDKGFQHSLIHTERGMGYVIKKAH